MQKQINGPLVIALVLLTSTSAARAAETPGSAIRALKALHSALSVGLTNRDYQQRLIDTNIIVDQYLETPRAGERSVQSIVERAMIIDRMALSVWNARLMSDDRVPLATIDALHEFPSCPNVRPITTRIRDNYPNSTDRANLGVDSSFTENMLPLLWACAADQIRSAEREMAKQGAKR